MKICTIIGARPQFIKAAAVSRAIAAHNRLTPDALVRQIENGRSAVRNVSRTIPEAKRSGTPLTEVIIHTGQHYDEAMSSIFFRELAMPKPKYNLNIGSGTHGQQTGKMLAGIEDVLLKEKPDWVLIYGDTNSTLAGALAAAKIHIPVAHIEAGLRSFNRRMPEEINRVVADHLSTVLFCPSQVSVDNLAAEGIPLPLTHNPLPITYNPLPITSNVLIVGDVMADALTFAVQTSSKTSNILQRLSLKPKQYLLATVHRAENTDDPQRLAGIMDALSEIAKRETVVLPIHPRTKKMLGDNYPSVLTPHSSHLTPHASLKFIDPVGYFDIIALEKSARMILTDSGGIQKEAYWLKVPCVTLRDETEWLETIQAGWNILTGANSAKIIKAVKTFKTPAKHPNLYGNGKTAEKIVKRLVKGNR